MSHHFPDSLSSLKDWLGAKRVKKLQEPGMVRALLLQNKAAGWGATKTLCHLIMSTETLQVLADEMEGAASLRTGHRKF